jgi:hypothetical protein
MGTAAGVDGAFAVWNVVTTFSDNDISAYSGWHSADGRSLVPSNPALQNPCGEIDPTPHEPPWIPSKSVGAKPYSPVTEHL